MRDDGHQLATKADLREFATKTDSRLDGIEGNLRRLNIGVARMEGDITELKGKVNILVEEFPKFTTTIDRMSNNIEAALRKMDMQGSMLMEHEGRITKLESRPS